MENISEATQLAALLTLAQKIELLEGIHFWETKTLGDPNFPYLRMADGSHGVRAQAFHADHLGLGSSQLATCFPTAGVLAQTWSPTLVQQIGARLAVEAKIFGINLLLGPGINLKRSPLCGRNFEYYSEDVLLTQQMATAFVNGIQKGGVGACLKHFAVNNQETERMTVDALVDARTLEELYLRSFFQVAKAAKPAAIMTSYNFINGARAEANTTLIQKLRQCYDGIILTDWGATPNLADGIGAGIDLEMPGGHGIGVSEVHRGIFSKKLDEARIDESVRRILTAAIRYPFWQDGESNQPSQSNQLGQSSQATQPNQPEISAEIKAENHRLAVNAAVQGTVLLSNREQLLPLSSQTSVALIGIGARTTPYQGRGSSRVTTTGAKSLFECMDGRFAGLRYAPAWRECDLVAPIEDSPSGALLPPLAKPNEPEVLLAQALVADALQTAKSVHVPIVCLQLDTLADLEGRDRYTLRLPSTEVDVTKQIIAVNPRTVLIVFAGGVVDLSELQGAAAIIYAGLGGERISEALTKIFLGEAEPSGRLAETWVNQIPADLKPRFDLVHVPYTDHLMVGYRRDIVRLDEVLFPFGHGLGYTTFALSDFVIQEGEKWRQAMVTVTNTGSRRGSTVVQLYAKILGSLYWHPSHSLIGFQKVELDVGASKRLVIALKPEAFACYEPQADRWLEAGGTALIMVGFNSSEHELTATINLSCDSQAIELAKSSSWASANFAQPNSLECPISPNQWRQFVDVSMETERKGSRITMFDTLRQARHKAVGGLIWRQIVQRRWHKAFAAGNLDAVLKLEVMADLPFYAWARMSGGMYSPKLAQAAVRLVNGRIVSGAFGLLWYGLLRPAKRRNTKSKKRGEL